MARLRQHILLPVALVLGTMLCLAWWVAPTWEGLRDLPSLCWQSLVFIAVSDYRLSVLACVAMVAARSWGTLRVRKYRGLPLIALPVWPLAFYWPLYVWCLEAPWSIQRQVFSGTNWSGTKEACAAISVLGWTPIYASALPLLWIAHVGAVTQGFVNEFRRPGLPWQVNLPFPVVVAVLGVYFVESAMMLMFAMLALQWH